MPAIESVTIRGFKSIASIDALKLENINIVIGANGSGKSNFLEAFSFLSAIQKQNLNNYVSQIGGANRVLHFGRKRTEKISFGLKFKKGTNIYQVGLSSTDTDQLIVSHERAGYKTENYDSPKWIDIAPNGTESGMANNREYISTYVNNHLKTWKRFHFHDTGPTSPLKQSANLHDNDALRFDGSNLAAFLYLLKERSPSAFEEIEYTIRQMAPFIKNLRLKPMALDPNRIRLEWAHQNSDDYFDVSSFSDGTLRFIALATLFLQPNPPGLILIDEPELGLHPFALTLLGSMIRKASLRSQIIVATQSSPLLDDFKPSEILVAERVNEATTFFRPNEDDLKVWLKEYSLGELWEKNYLGGRP